jgi:cobalt/nickel transport system ATP-binding protein
VVDSDNVVFEASHLHFSYGRGHEALVDVSFRITRGARVAILGANGSGKSTLLKLLDALYFPTGGQLIAFGLPLTEELMQDEAWAFAFRRRVGLVFQDPDVQLFSPTVWDDVVFGPLHLGLSPAEVRARAWDALRLLNIERLADRPPHRLSGGEKKKVALATVLASRPDVLLLDEPTASLDPRSQGNLLDFLCMISETHSTTLVTATHDLTVAHELADWVLVFAEDHRLLAQGTPVEVLADRDLLIRANLIHEHTHRHGVAMHAHEHLGVHTHSTPEGEPVGGERPVADRVS